MDLREMLGSVDGLARCAHHEGRKKVRWGMSVSTELIHCNKLLDTANKKIDEYKQAMAEKDRLIERLTQEAEAHAQEARTANHTIAEIYQVVSGATGEPGNWHGAEPVRRRMAEKDREIAHLQDVYTAQRIKREEAYQQLMEKAVRFAEAYRKAHLSNWIDLHMATKDPVYVEAQAFLQERKPKPASPSDEQGWDGIK